MTILAAASAGNKVKPGNRVNMVVKGGDPAGNILSRSAGGQLQGLHIDLAQQSLQVLFFRRAVGGIIYLWIMVL